MNTHLGGDLLLSLIGLRLLLRPPRSRSRDLSHAPPRSRSLFSPRTISMFSFIPPTSCEGDSKEVWGERERVRESEWVRERERESESERGHKRMLTLPFMFFTASCASSSLRYCTKQNPLGFFVSLNWGIKTARHKRTRHAPGHSWLWMAGTLTVLNLADLLKHVPQFLFRGVQRIVSDDDLGSGIVASWHFDRCTLKNTHQSLARSTNPLHSLLSGANSPLFLPLRRFN